MFTRMAPTNYIQIGWKFSLIWNNWLIRSCFFFNWCGLAWKEQYIISSWLGVLIELELANKFWLLLDGNALNIDYHYVILNSCIIQSRLQVLWCQQVKGGKTRIFFLHHNLINQVQLYPLPNSHVQSIKLNWMAFVWHNFLC